ncbi:hypothetical protein [Geothrix sp. 21YS21S-4]|uniref:hypothetical protein n=1 Tax=Geothrix sp. 21YS21S-4 TaxID=3068889 RepID=UPI0027B9E0A3|nr:hypothetical protein [Geothrix sp. 21YS21S-4]
MRCLSFVMTALLVVAGGSTRAAEEGPGLSVSVSVEPAPSRPEACLCTAEVKDLETGQLLAVPRLMLPKGEAGKMSVGDPAVFEVLFDITIDRTGAAATYVVTCRRKGRVMGIQKGSLSLRPPA